MKKLVVIASLLISSNIAYADGQSHDHDMKKMEHSHAEMSKEDMKDMKDMKSEGKKFEHEHKGKHSPIKMKKEQNMDDMNMEDTEKMHDHSKMK